MTRFAFSALVIALFADCRGSRCAPGDVPNDELQACVRPVKCDGGTVNARNECEAPPDAGSESSLDAGDGMRSFPQRQNSAAGASDPGAVAGSSGGVAGSAGGSPVAGGAGAAGASAAGAAGGPSPIAKPACGNGMREGNEVCDGADCVTECKSDNTCIAAKLEGSPMTCDVKCSMTEITVCRAGDGCCPMGCDHASDSDCSERCGDGELSDKELCEPGSSMYPCPTAASCDDRDPCTMDRLTGDPMQCSAKCAHTNIMRAAISCDDNDPCTDDGMVESSTECSYACTHSTPRTPTGSCVDTDPCTDDTPVESTTRCAYECPHRRQQPMAAACDDGDPCTDDTPEMSRTKCAFECPHNPLPNGTPCMTTGSCSSGRCQYCGDGVVNRGEECDPAATGWNSTTCSSACKRTMYKRCNANSQCSNGQSCWAGYCTTACTENTTPNGPGTECPRIPNVPEPFCYTNKCVLPCKAVSDCPAGLDQCDNSATLGFSGNGTTCSSTALGNP